MKLDTTGIEVQSVELMDNSVIQMKFIQKGELETQDVVVNLKPLEFMEAFTEDQEFENGSLFTHHYIKMAVFGPYVNKIDPNKPKHMTVRDIESKLGHKVYITS